MKTVQVLPRATLIFFSLFLFIGDTLASPPPCVVTPAGLVGWWRGENNALDAIGPNHGTLNGATFVSGRVGQGFSLDGLDDYVTVNDSPSLSPHLGPNGQMTLQAWVRISQLPASSSQGRVAVAAKGTPNNWEYALYVYSNGTVGFSTWRLDGALAYAEPTGGAISLNAWHLLTGTLVKGQFARIYLDGTRVMEYTTFGSDTGDGTSPFFIGRRGDGQFFKGEIDEVQLFNHALTASEIQAIYAAGPAGICDCSTPPAITLTGGNPQTIECHSAYTELGATASDTCDGDLNSMIAIDSGGVNVNAVGSYAVSYNVSDAQGTPALPVVRTINVIDTTKPMITLLGSNPVTVECHTSFTDPGATASDNCAGDLTSALVVTGDVDVNIPGSYTLHYNVKDQSNNAAVEVTRTVSVIDATKPIITLLGSNPVTVECHTSFTDPGATASDNCAGDLTSALVVTGDVDVNIPGSYTLHYNVKDPSNNAAVEVTRTVSVIDATKPIITLLGSNPVTVECHTSFTDPGATASDNCAGDLTSALVVTGNVDVNIPGSYTLRYNVKDPSNNAAMEVTRTVSVIDATKPIITLLGSNPLTVECHTSFTDPGATASDACAGDLTSGLVVTGDVDVNTTGTYMLRYNVKDPSNNAAVQATRTVNVIDTSKPTIRLLGNNPLTIECHTSFTDPGATASDTCAGDLTSAIVASGSVDVNNVGSYVLRYIVRDPSDNVSVELTRIIKVVDTRPPSLVCPAPLSVSADPKSEMFAIPEMLSTISVSDECSPAASIVVVQDPSPGTLVGLGTHEVTLTATDASGNDTSCTTSVTVTANNRAPVVTMLGPASGYVTPVNSLVQLSASFSDDGPVPHTAEWIIYNGGFPDLTLSGIIRGTSVAGSVSFAKVGTYSIKLIVNDRGGLTGTATTVMNDLPAYVVVYDPNGAFVTGSGWINSPPGAYVAEPKLTGRAQFGFTSKYQKGVTTPTGESKFQFQAGNLNFQSVAYQWLLVSGAEAKLGGTGTVNGKGNYSFQISAIDGDVNKGGGADKLRIQITDSKGLVYDNVPNARGTSDDANPPAINTGSIAIHK